LRHAIFHVFISPFSPYCRFSLSPRWRHFISILLSIFFAFRHHFDFASFCRRQIFSPFDFQPTLIRQRLIHSDAACQAADRLLPFVHYAIFSISFQAFAFRFADSAMLRLMLIFRARRDDYLQHYY